ncbi:MAG: ATP-binding protein [Coleofasciculus sp. B1-GNL1-01]|uniref:hybrid sensor histidine kinase/response regulator n=1 Tax=Coleofasciculus sp. B1-GNL1-01 TaxID=3068484 RepID=UPI003302DD8E
MNIPQILIVEDEIILARTISLTIENLGYQVAGIADSGEEAIQIVSEVQPDLVLMDIVLEGELSGIEAAEQIRDRLDIPVIYLTAYGDQDTINKATQTDPFGYIIKPIEPDELSATIKIALRKHDLLKTLNQAKIEAEENQQNKSQMVSMVSHEGRNSLTAIKSSSDIMERYSERLSDAKKQKHIQKIQLAADQMLCLLEDLLFLNKAESGMFTLHPSWVDLDNFCQEIVESFETGDAQPTIRFKFVGESNTYLDMNLLRHILTNLLSNAIKYSPNSGEVKFEITSAQKTVSFCIQDSGIGIPPEDLQNLFTAFHRAQNVGQIKGTGLGLSIVKQCVDLHQGSIDVDSKVGAGTTFTVTLPVLNNETASLEKQAEFA